MNSRPYDIMVTKLEPNLWDMLEDTERHGAHPGFRYYVRYVAVNSLVVSTTRFQFYSSCPHEYWVSIARAACDFTSTACSMMAGSVGIWFPDGIYFIKLSCFIIVLRQNWIRNQVVLTEYHNNINLIISLPLFHWIKTLLAREKKLIVVPRNIYSKRHRNILSSLIISNY